MIHHLWRERGLDGGAGGIVDVNNAAVAVAAFAREMVFAVFTGKGHTAVDQPLDGLGGLLDRKAGSYRVVQVRTRIQRVFDMAFQRVGAVEDGRNTALRPTGGGVGDGTLADQADLEPGIGQTQCRALAGQAAADDQHVEVGSGRRMGCGEVQDRWPVVRWTL